MITRGIEHITLHDVDSTNNYAKTIDLSASDKLLVIRAKRQSGGRGRGDNAFFSDHPGGLWVSVVTPTSEISNHFTYNRAISLSIADALRGVGKNAPVSIKWPNDVYWGDRKIAGILLEMTQNAPNSLIVGFGVNVNMGVDVFPDNLRDSATSVLIETGREVSIDKLLESVLMGYLWYCDDDQSIVHQTYLDNLYKRGERATLDGQDGTFVSVEADGRLRFRVDGEHEMLFTAGTLRFL